MVVPPVGRRGHDGGPDRSLTELKQRALPPHVVIDEPTSLESAGEHIPRTVFPTLRVQDSRR
jgi:hypothetical protein